jgi:cysteinyl-tRNA synthetase
MSDDLNSPVVLGFLFEGVRIINSVNDGKESINVKDLELLRNFMRIFTSDILGLVPEEVSQTGDHELLDKVIQLLLQQRKEAKERKDYAASDNIRNQLAALGILVKDTKDGVDWEREQ